MDRVRYGVTWSFHALSSHATLEAPPGIQLSGNSLDPVILGFMKASLSRHDWLNIVSDQENLSTFPHS
jgi:hypothetical protein